MNVLMFDLDGTLIDRQGVLFGGVAGIQIARQLVPEPPVQELLAGLADHFHIAVVTNGSSSRQRLKLRRSGLEAYVGSVTISGAVGVAKPHCGMFLRACRDARCAPDEVAMMIGDDAVCDIAGAATLGIATCWVQRGRVWPAGLTPPTHSVDSIFNVAEVLRCSMLAH